MAGKAVSTRVSGRVQGVGFRAWVAREARALELTGWVRNEPDGTVAALLAGDEKAVETMLRRLRRGPSAALVENLAIEPVEAAYVPDEFRILR